MYSNNPKSSESVGKYNQQQQQQIHYKEWYIKQILKFQLNCAENVYPENGTVTMERRNVAENVMYCWTI